MSGLNAFFWILVNVVDLLNLTTGTVKDLLKLTSLPIVNSGQPMALQLASSKIPAELMERLKRFTDVSGANQSAVIRQAIEQFLDNAESTGLTQLTHSEGSFKPSELMARVDAVDCRLTEIETRLLEVEGRSVKTEPIAVSPEPQAKETPPPPPDGKPLADGIQWLLTNEAWKLAKKRGCRRDYASFAKHAKAHPDRLDTWGLRFLGSNKPGDHRRASFQDLLGT